MVRPNVSQQSEIVFSNDFRVPIVPSLGWCPVQAIVLNMLCAILTNALMWAQISQHFGIVTNEFTFTGEK